MQGLHLIKRHLDLLWQDRKGRYDERLRACCHDVLTNASPLSGMWIDALRTARKLDPDAARALDGLADQPLLTRSMQRLTFLLAYLLETGHEPQAGRLFDENRKRLVGLIDQSPALCWLANRRLPPDQQPPLAQLFRRAPDNRAGFADWVSDPQHRITLLGNGQIDRQAELPGDPDHLVIDFNHPQHGVAIPQRSRHAWVRTPNGSVPSRPDTDLDWVIFTGNDSLYQRIRFAPLLPSGLDPNKYVFVPSRIWLELVNKLQAPPSAGLIMLHWIARLRGGLDSVGLHGFSIAPGDHELNNKPGRHRWDREREFLNTWLKDRM